MNQRVRRPPDYTLLALVLGLTVFGLVMVYSSSFMIAVDEGHSQIYYLLRQTMWAVIGCLGLLVAQRLDYRMWRKLALPLMAATLIMLVMVILLPESVTKRGGAERWIRLGPIGVQPSEVAKLSLIVYLASWLMGRGTKLRSMTVSLLPFAIIMAIVLSLVMLQPNLSTTIILGVIGVSVYFAAGANLVHIIGGLILGSGMGYLLMTTAAYRMERFLVYQDPWQYYRDGGFQPIHAMYALASGGWIGRGLGQSRQKFNWLPSAHADAIYSVIGEELGIVGTILVLVTFLFLAYRGFRIASRASDPFGALVAVGITSSLTFQAFVNMAVVAQVIPFTGVTLPFISYGGSSLAMSLFSVGILLNISKYVDDQPPELPPATDSRPQAVKRRPIAAFPAIAAFMRRRNRGPRLSSTSRSFGFSRKVAAAPNERATGWRRLSSVPANRTGRGARRRATAFAGSWRKH